MEIGKRLIVPSDATETKQKILEENLQPGDLGKKISENTTLVQIPMMNTQGITQERTSIKKI